MSIGIAFLVLAVIAIDAHLVKSLGRITKTLDRVRADVRDLEHLLDPNAEAKTQAMVTAL